MCHSGCEDHRQHRAGHGAAPLHVRRHWGPVVQGEVLDVFRPDPAGRGVLSGGVLHLQGRGGGGPDRGGAETLVQERVQLRQCSQGDVDSLRCGHI